MKQAPVEPKKVEVTEKNVNQLLPAKLPEPHTKGLIKASGVQVVNATNYVTVGLAWRELGKGTWNYVGDVQPLNESFVISPPVAEYEFVVWLYPNYTIYYYQQYERDPASFVSIVTVR